MDLQRAFLIGGLVIVGYLLWQAWQEDYHTPQAIEDVVVENMLPTSDHQDVAQPHNDVVGGVDVTHAISEATDADWAEQTLNELAADQSDFILVETDVLRVWIDPEGGNLVQADLLDYAQTLESDSAPVRILSPDSSDLYIAQSGLSSAQGPDKPESGQARFTTAQQHYVLDTQAGDEQLKVDLNWTDGNGLQVEKSFVFQQGSYLIAVAYEVDNQSAQTWQGQFYGQYKRKEVGEGGLLGLATYQGAAISSPDKRYEKVTYKNMRKSNLDRTFSHGWLAMLQHYFVSAWIPNPEQSFRYLSWQPEGDIYRTALVGPVFNAEPGETAFTQAEFYLGPKIADDLKAAAPHLDLTVDYGWFWPISVALFWLMKKFFEVFSNWGVAIILVTLVVKVIFYKLSAASYRSMANMRRVQPKIVAMRERFGSDKQKMSKAMMDLYRKEKINPLGGCLPILIQIPVFIALYWVLLESVEFRQAPFMLWIHDLSAKDPYYVLPIIMGISMLLQQKLNPPPPDPMQAKLLMLMPILFTVLFITFPAGLVLYWVVNNVLSIAQQYVITRSIEKQAQTKK